MEDIKQVFEQKHKIGITIVYGGSDTLLSTIQQTRKGDIFIPGAAPYIKNAGALVVNDQYVALHIPAFYVRIDNQNKIQSFEDLLRPGIKLAVGNKDMCAIGKVAGKIISGSGREADFAKNITMTGSTVNELLDLVIRENVDSSMVWSDMGSWPKARGLKMVEIPPAINKTEEIHVAVLTSTVDRKSAGLFADFVAAEGRAIFTKHGFGEK